jgi:RimJ/RimL family protein N-acetyltransferase
MDVFIQGVQESSAKAVDQVGWERSWGLFEGTEIRGTIQLRHSPKLESNLHRALLAMGIERGQRGQGWARAQSSLEWIDLGVFEHNAPARALYSRFGFREAGRREDLFRVFKTQITDIEMVLKLR